VLSQPLAFRGGPAADGCAAVGTGLCKRIALFASVMLFCSSKSYIHSPLKFTWGVRHGWVTIGVSNVQAEMSARKCRFLASDSLAQLFPGQAKKLFINNEMAF